MAKSSKTIQMAAVAIVAIVAVAAIGFVLLGNQDDTPALEKIKKRGKLIVGTSSGFPPFEIANPDSPYGVEGFDIDLAKKIADKLGVELEVQDLDFDVLIQSVIEGKIDLILAGMTINSDRAQSVLFSNPYFVDQNINQAVIVKDSTTDITKVDDLAGKKITVNSGTTGYYWVEEHLINTGKVAAGNVIQYGTASNTVQELLRPNGADAIIIDSAVAQEFVENNAGIHIAFTIPTNESYGVAMKLGETSLAKEINDLLAEMESNGEMNALREKWGV
ncbi:MAG TPA: transporter substrate-binding domain-containing protein [Euryarchaeota archaeon]|jgi:ABC-type amino acid transport substrate-binding protein|nr:transporter substrate-binding domain-containing protein [Euryarchaeota archaeon]